MVCEGKLTCRVGGGTTLVSHVLGFGLNSCKTVQLLDKHCN